MSNKTAIPSRHYARQPIMSHKEVVKALSERTGVSNDDVDKVLCQLPFLLQDSFENFVGVRFTGLGTFRGQLITGKNAPFLGETERTRILIDTMSKDRIVPDFSLSLTFKKQCKAIHQFLNHDTFYGLASNRLQQIIQSRPTDPYATQAIHQAHKEASQEDGTENEPRRFHVELATPILEETAY